MKHKIRIYIILVIAYLLVAIPFKVMEVIPGFTDIRPVTLLGPVYALFYGTPGCIIFAIMNLVMDAVSGQLMWSSIAGLLANFAGPFLFLLYWKKVANNGPYLRTPGNIIHFSVILFLKAILEAVMITPSVALIYPDINWMVFFVSVVANTSFFPILFGIPLIILMKEELGFKMIV
ncbi:MAG: hypothetical protein IKE53_08375 [Clostridiales bacterium]|nr:hypothetical protein [Clostridiales bacterium]